MLKERDKKNTKTRMVKKVTIEIWDEDEQGHMDDSSNRYGKIRLDRLASQFSNGKNMTFK